MSTPNKLHDLMDKIFDIKEKISDQEYIDLCSRTRDIRSLLVVEDHDDDFESNDYETDNEEELEDNQQLLFYDQLTIDYPEFGISGFEQTMDELFDIYVIVPKIVYDANKAKPNNMN